MRNASETTENIGGYALAESSHLQGSPCSLSSCLTRLDGNDANTNSAIAKGNSVNSDDANSDVVNIYLAQARAYQAEHQWQKSIGACQAALKISPNSPEAYRLLGNLHQQQDKAADALGFYAKALSLQPHSAEVYSNLGSLYAKQKDWEKAIAYFKKALAQDPQFAPAYFNLSKVWKQLDSAEEAKGCLLAALKLAPDMGTAEDHYQVAKALEKERKFEDAITFYQQFVDRAPTKSPDILSAYQRLTELLEENGDWKAATECYRKVLTLTMPAEPPSPERLPGRKKLHKTSALSNLSGLSKRDQRLMYKLLQASSQKKMLLPAKGAKALLQPAPQPLSQATSQAIPQQFTHQQWAQAIQQLKQALKQSPRSAPLYRKLAKVLSYNKQIEQSAEAWFRAFLLEPDWPSSQQYFELGKRLEAYGKVKPAAHCYQQVLRAQPEADAVRERLLQLQQQISQGEAGKEKVAQKKVDRELINHSRLQKQKTNAQRISTQSPETQYRIRSAQTLKPQQVQALANAMHQKGETLQKAGEWQAAKDAYQKAIQLNPNFSWSYHSLGDCYRKLSLWQDAADAYKVAIRLNDSFVWSHYSLAECLGQLGQWQDAAVAYERANELDPASAQIAMRLAEAQKKCAILEMQKSSDQYLQLAQKEGMDETIYREAISLTPEDIELYLRLGKVLTSNQKFDEAIFVYQTALTINDSHLEACLQLAQVLSEQKQFARALECIERAMKISPHNYNVHLKQGEILSDKGDLSAALEAFQACLKLDDSSHWAYQCIGNVHLWQDNAEEAISAYQEVLRREPNLAMAHKQMGEALTMLGKVDEASESFAKAIEIDLHVV